MNYFELIFTTLIEEDYQQDLLIHELSEAGFDTFEDLDFGFKAYIPTKNFDQKLVDEKIAYLKAQFAFSYEINLIPAKNWNEVWESNFEPVTIGRDVLVRATFHPSQPGFKHQIVIDPKMAFGTGHHQTTALMMQFMLESSFTGKTVLDMGAGTGILAILAGQLGAERIVAIDNDEACFASIRENSMQNGQLHIEAFLGSKEAIPEIRFDAILANINRNILLDQLTAYASVLKVGGELFLSGFYTGEDVGLLVAEAGRNGLTFVSEKSNRPWAALKLIK